MDNTLTSKPGNIYHVSTINMIKNCIFHCVSLPHQLTRTPSHQSKTTSVLVDWVDLWRTNNCCFHVFTAHSRSERMITERAAFLPFTLVNMRSLCVIQDCTLSLPALISQLDENILPNTFLHMVPKTHIGFGKR